MHATINDPVIGPIDRTLTDIAADVARMAADVQETLRSVGQSNLFGEPITEEHALLQMERLADFAGGWARKFRGGAQ